MGGRKLLAKWVSRGYKHWCELYRVTGSNGNPDWISYQSRNRCGCIGSINPVLTEARAVTIMQDRVDRGWFMPDGVVNMMERLV